MRVIPVKVPAGADPITYLTREIDRLGLNGGAVTGIGGFKRVKIGVLKAGGGYEVRELVATDKYYVEAAPLVGNYVRLPDGGVSIHIHAVVGREHGLTWCGHLVEGEVWPFLEIFLHESGPDVGKVFDHRIRR